MKYVIKRDGTKQPYNINKIFDAIMAAMREVYEQGSPVSGEDWNEIAGNAERISDEVHANLPDKWIEIEQLQDIVERSLMKDHAAVAKAYILYRSRHAELRELKPDTKAVADYIHASKYAKYLSNEKRRETYSETVSRSKKMHINKFPTIAPDIDAAFKFVYDKKVLPSMRSMQFGGEAIEAHNSRMYNCTFTLVDRPRVFQEIFYLLLSGCGVGFSVQGLHVEKLPVIGEPDKKKILFHNVVDDIEGWSDAIGLLFNSYEAGLYFEPCYQKIRPVGAPLKTGGGRAPGHMPLKRLIEAVRRILDDAIGRKLRPIECHDIICHIAEAVLAGGIRRSSLISLFSKDDLEMLSCKSPEHFQYGGVNAQREMANNSVVLLRTDTKRSEFIHLMTTNRKTYGEPGFMFTNHLDWGTNPCGEIGIDPTIDGKTGFGFCNLTEVNVAACTTNDDFLDACGAAVFIGTLQASYTDFLYLGEITKKICERDALIGVGLTGIMDNPKIGLDYNLLRQGGNSVKDLNAYYANKIGINAAARCTTVKPSGTGSLALGCIASGIHAHHAERYFRRITANENEPIMQYFRQHNPHMVERKPNGDMCLTFPVTAPKGAMTLGKLKAVDFMNIIFNVYDSWILGGTHDPGVLTHNISSTVVVDDNDWDAVLEHAWNNRNRIRSMSFFPRFGDKGIPFAPREEVLEADEARWKKLIHEYVEVDYSKMVESEDGTNLKNEAACIGGACEVVHTGSLEIADGTIFSTDCTQFNEKYIHYAPAIDVGGINVTKSEYKPYYK